MGDETTEPPAPTWTRGPAATGHHPSSPLFYPPSPIVPSPAKKHHDDDDDEDDVGDDPTHNQKSRDFEKGGGRAESGGGEGEKEEERKKRMQQHPSYSTIQDRIYPAERKKRGVELKNEAEKNDSSAPTAGLGPRRGRAGRKRREKAKGEDDDDDHHHLHPFRDLDSRYDKDLLGQLLDANLTRLTDRFPRFSAVQGSDMLTDGAADAEFLGGVVRSFGHGAATEMTTRVMTTTPTLMTVLEAPRVVTLESMEKARQDQTLLLG